MSAQPRQPKAAAAAAPTHTQLKEFSVPVQVADYSMFDDAYVFMREKFSEQMRRVDEEMFQLGKALTNFNNQKFMIQTGMTAPKSDTSVVGWDTITSSPLVEDEGDEKMLKLQFDVSQFDPEEVHVHIADDLLTVAAHHEEKTDRSASYREYNRQFLLPKGTNPSTVVSSLTRDGVLTVQTPLKQPIESQADSPSGNPKPAVTN